MPRDWERYKQYADPEKTIAENEIRLRYDVHHARAWANDHAPALAVSYAQAEASPERAAYLTARGELIDSWNHAQRPIGAELAGEPEQTRPTNTDTAVNAAGCCPFGLAWNTIPSAVRSIRENSQPTRPPRTDFVRF